MIHSFRHLLAMVILTIVGITCAAGNTSAQTCIVVNGVKVYVDSNTVIVNGVSGGYGFTFLAPFPPTGPLNEFFTVSYMQINGVDPSLGTITIDNDPSRSPSLSSLISNNPPIRFPATGTIRFYATATFSSNPGVVYTSSTELVFENTNLIQVFPFGNAAFTLTTPVVFIPPAGSGAPISLLPPAYVTLP